MESIPTGLSIGATPARAGSHASSSHSERQRTAAGRPFLRTVTLAGGRIEVARHRFLRRCERDSDRNFAALAVQGALVPRISNTWPEKREARGIWSVAAFKHIRLS